MPTTSDYGSWDEALLAQCLTRGSIASIARERRLMLEDNQGAKRIDLLWIDEVGLGLLELARRSGSSLTLVYPAPVCDVGVLLAAQALISIWLEGRDNPRVGLATTRPAAAQHIWTQLCLKPGAGNRELLSAHFPLWRADEHGRAAVGPGDRGLVLGSRCDGWDVDITIIDCTDGVPEGAPCGHSVTIIANPLDRSLEARQRNREAIWGWSHASIRGAYRTLEHRTPGTVPFSVAHERLEIVEQGVEQQVITCHHAEAESALARLRDDLITLSREVGAAPPKYVSVGLMTAWSHAVTLASLPCPPDDYDRHCGRPPRAARATTGFESEIAAWSSTLSGNLADYFQIVAADLGDLRYALSKGTPFLEEVRRLAAEDVSTVLVLRSRTAARALAAELGLSSEKESVDRLSLTWLSRLSTQHSWDRCVFLGPPPRSACYRLDSGVGRKLCFLVLGDAEATIVRRGIAAEASARDHWASDSLHAAAWELLIGPPVPSVQPTPPSEQPSPELLGGAALRPDIDPFSPLGGLLVDDRPLLGDEGPSEFLARQNAQGEWRALIDAIEVETDQGYVLIPTDGEIDVLDGDVQTTSATALRPGMRVVIGRSTGRLGLLEALEDRLKHRPDLLAARILVQGYRELVHHSFLHGQLGFNSLCQQLRELGCTKTVQSMESWVLPGGPMAPRDYEDYLRLASVLHLDMSEERLRATFQSVKRIRGFRRATGRALAQAAIASVSAEDASRIDPETGLSVADLREAILVARVTSIRALPAPVRMTDVGQLREETYA